MRVFTAQRERERMSPKLQVGLFFTIVVCNIISFKCTGRKKKRRKNVILTNKKIKGGGVINSRPTDTKSHPRMVCPHVYANLCMLACTHTNTRARTHTA